MSIIKNKTLFSVCISLILSVWAAGTSKAETICEKDTMWYYGLGNLASSGFFCPDDGGCTYMSINTLTKPELNKDAHPFTLDLLTPPDAYWIDKDLFVCFWPDMSYMKLEVLGSISYNDVGLNQIPNEDVSYGDGDQDIYVIHPDVLLANQKFQEWKWFYSVIHEYYSRVINLEFLMGHFQEQPTQKEIETINFKVTLPQARFTFLNVPVIKVRDCMKIIGSFSLLRR